MIQILTMPFLIVIYVVSLFSGKHNSIETKSVSSKKLAAFFIGLFVVSFFTQYAILYYNQEIRANISISLKIILYVLVFSPIIETCAVGGIFAIFQYIFKKNQLYYYLVFSCLFWGLIHGSENIIKLTWQSIGLGFISYVYMILHDSRGKMTAFSLTTILHSLANLGMLVAMMAQ